jgi:hypothetical protein
MDLGMTDCCGITIVAPILNTAITVGSVRPWDIDSHSHTSEGLRPGNIWHSGLSTSSTIIPRAFPYLSRSMTLRPSDFRIAATFRLKRVNLRTFGGAILRDPSEYGSISGHSESGYWLHTDVAARSASSATKRCWTLPISSRIAILLESRSCGMGCRSAHSTMQHSTGTFSGCDRISRSKFARTFSKKPTDQPCSTAFRRFTINLSYDQPFQPIAPILLWSNFDMRNSGWRFDRGSVPLIRLDDPPTRHPRSSFPSPQPYTTAIRKVHPSSCT